MLGRRLDRHGLARHDGRRRAQRLRRRLGLDDKPSNGIGRRCALRDLCARARTVVNPNLFRLLGTFIPKFFTKGAYWSGTSTMMVVVGFPAPSPARVSIR